jgi:hypothetical protein
LWNSIQEHPADYIVVFKMFPNRTIRRSKFEAMGSIGRIGECMPADVEPGAVLCGSDYYNVYNK